MEGPQDEQVCTRSNKGTSRPTRKPGRDNEKKKACMVPPHHSPQKPSQSGAAGNSDGQQKRWAEDGPT